MDILINATVTEVWSIRQRRRHRDDQLQRLSNSFQQSIKSMTNWQKTKVLWKAKGDTYKPRFRTKETWNHLWVHQSSPEVQWHIEVYGFPHALLVRCSALGLQCTSETLVSAWCVDSLKTQQRLETTYSIHGPSHSDYLDFAHTQPARR